MRLFAAAGALTILAMGPASSQQILKNEPPVGGAGGLRAGEVVFVDNGRCPKGQVLKLTAGVAYGGRNGAAMSGSKRTRECVPHP